MIERDKLIGSWKLASIKVLGANAAGRRPPFGLRPQGVLHYTAENRMAALLQDADRPPMPNGRQGASAEDMAQASRGFSAYAGTFVIDGDRIIHQVEFNSYPNDIGTDYPRIARLEGDVLILETPPDQPPGGLDLRLTWHRMDG